MKSITKDLEFCGIYMIINLLNGKRYIGSSVNIRQRLWTHRSELRHNHHSNAYLQSAWNKYGESNFDYSILEKCSEDNKFDREQFYIDTMCPEYNICIEVVNNPPKSEDTRKKHSITRKKLMQEGKISITNNKPVWIYNSNGEFVGHWESIRQAAKALCIHYSSACRVMRGVDYQTNGYKFFEQPQDIVEPFHKPTNSEKMKITYVVDDGENQLLFRGVKEIANYFNTTIGNIQIHITKHKKFHKKYMIYKQLPCN